MQTREGAIKTRSKLLSRNPNYYSDMAKRPRKRKVTNQNADLICQSDLTNEMLANKLKVSTRTISRYRKACK